MKRVLTALILLLGLTPVASAQELHLLSLRELNIEYYRIDNHRDSYFEYADRSEQREEHWVGGTAANYTLDMVKYGNWGLYWDNRIHGEGTDAQFREVGWQYELGLQLGPKLQAYWNHHSRHVLDDSRADRFPLDNFYGVRWVYYRRAE
jgi:hypothetical protein